jgi:nuclear migration protein JNM1
VSAREIDFSDTIATKRKAYKSRSGHRRRRHGDGTEEIGDISDSDTDGQESFERKLARLRRETEELKAELQRRDQAGQNDGPGNEGDEDDDDGISELSKALDSIHYSSTRANATSDAVLSRKLAAAVSTSKDTNTAEKRGVSSPATLTAQSSGLLEHAASFDTRLTLMEAALGISSGSNPFFAAKDAQPQLQPVLPALEHLTSQITALTGTLGGPTASSTAASTTTTTTAQLESLSSRIKRLTADAENLANARRRASEVAARAQPDSPSGGNGDASTSSGVAEVNNTESNTQREEQAAKIQALYATLPTIQSLHPLLPSVLERLRSLRAIHAGAAQASETLDALEKDQAEMSKEIEQWREGLTIVEEKVRESEVSMKKNIEYVGPWVEDLKKRMDRLEQF